MFQRFKTFLKEIDDSIKLYLAILVMCIAIAFRWFAMVPMEEGFGSNIRVEFFGFLFDLLIFGLGFSIFNKWNQRKQDIKRWQEEIDDFRGWDEKEAMFRIVGNIRRLNRAGVTKIDLSGCCLRGANLSDLNLRGSTFFETDLRDADLGYSDFSEVLFSTVYLQGAYLKGTVFDNASFSGVNLEDAKVGEPWWFDDLRERGVKQAEVLSKIYAVEYDDKNSIDIVKRRSKIDF
jgi:hypothetical protein